MPTYLDSQGNPVAQPSALPPAVYLDDNGNPAQPAKPSLVSDALKYSPVGMVKGLADMISTAASGQNPFKGMAQANEKILEKAKDSFSKGDYGQAIAHFANYLNPLGGAFEDVSQDLQDGNIGHAAAKFAGLTSSLAAGAKAPAVLNAATNPEAITGIPAKVAAGVKRAAPDVVTGIAKVGAGEALAQLPGMEFPARIAIGYPGARQIAAGIQKGFEGGEKTVPTDINSRIIAAASRPVSDLPSQPFVPPAPSPAPAAAPLVPETSPIAGPAVLPSGRVPGGIQNQATPTPPRLSRADVLPVWSGVRDAAPPDLSPVEPIPGALPSGRKVGGIQNQATPAPVVVSPGVPAVPSTRAAPLPVSYAGFDPYGPKAAPVVAAPTDDPALLEAISRSYADKPFAKLSDADKVKVKALAAQAVPRQAPPQPPATVPVQPAPPVVVPPATAVMRNGQPSVAEQLRDLTAPGIKPDANGVATINPAAPEASEIPDPETLKTMMREFPAGAPKAVANANYAGNQEPAQAAAVYEAAGRATKSQAMSQMLHDEGLSAQTVSKWSAKAFQKAASDRGLLDRHQPFSAESRGEVIEMLKRLEGTVKQ